MRSRLYSPWLAVVAVIAACALGIVGLPAAAFAQSPAVTYTPSSGPVGTSFTITGSNWMPGGQVTSTLPYGSPGWFTGYQAPTVDANGKFSYTETVGTGPGGPTPSGTYTSTYVENSLSATQTFTVTTGLATLPDLLTSSELPACVLSMTALSLGLVGASGAALPVWSDAVRLLSATGSVGTFLSKLQTDPYWKALLTAAVVQPLNNCFIGVQKLLQATSGQAGMAVGQYLRDHFRRA